MKKSGADDISNLFKQFGGQADRYQEIAQANEARLSRERWPLLNAIGSERAPSPPPVPAASSAPPPLTAEPVRETPRPFLSARTAEARRKPAMAPPPSPSASPLRDRYVTPSPAPTPSEQPPAAQQEAPAAASPSLTQLFSKLEAAAETPEPAASTSSLFRRLSQT